MSVLEKALEGTSITLKKYDPLKSRPVYTGRGSLLVETFVEEVRKVLGKNLKKYPELVECLVDQDKMTELLQEWADENKPEEGQSTVSIPTDLSHLLLNIDMSAAASSRGRYFCTTSEELRDLNTHGEYYVGRIGLTPPEAITLARPVVPKYMPRNRPGIHPTKDPTTLLTISYFNSYVPAPWDLWRIRNPKEWNKLPAKPPKEIIEMLQHVIPLKKEREYFYAWLYKSITSRVYVYLVLQGSPGVGKNRIKLLFTALHGKDNSMDGKKETFGANGSKFNGQLFENTGGWFDELKYDSEMEPRMKEYQNDSASKELKGVDATKNSDIHASMVISNNKPRDNYILFNSRKFAPLVLGEHQLNTVMAPETIDYFSSKLEEGRPEYDVKYVAQIAKWILRVGEKYVDNFPWMEYQGPKFWELAHTSMSRWQKIAVSALTNKTPRGYFPGWHPDKQAFKWSEVEEALRRKRELSERDYRDASTIKAFFDTYRDTKGERVFETEALSALVQDFWVRPIKSVKEVHGPLTVDLGEGEQVTVLAANDPGRPPGPRKTEAPKLVRPPGTSQFKWRKMREEHEAKYAGRRHVNGEDKEPTDWL